LVRIEDNNVQIRDVCIDEDKRRVTLKEVLTVGKKKRLDNVL
jgi:hypothetical protein